ncbi:MAG: DUF1549 and DUF1553 domain-containing protein [Pirellulales bacterium]|nr:DUF1549 and DUF1553 domain-containing protein [Pirellulales bacterium]
MWKRNLLFALVAAAGLLALAGSLAPTRPPLPRDGAPLAAQQDVAFRTTLTRLNQAFREAWQQAGIKPAPRADELTVIRRLSLALEGTIPSLEELRQFEERPAQDRLNWWLAGIFADVRHHDYLAERLARAYVGTKGGPFVLYRRRRFVSWLADELAANRPYDQLVRRLIASNGLWTSTPAVNFLTVTIVPDNEQGVNERELAARVARAFLAKRIDCAECHDHPFDRWKQADFEGLAAFFGQAENSLRGIQDDPKAVFEVEEPETKSRRRVEPRVPYRAELVPAEGTLRERLAGWVTHPQNKEFSRAIVNRVWNLMFGRPLVEPVDDVRLDQQVLPAMDILAEDFAQHGFNLRRLILLIAASEVFQLDSRSDPADPAHQITPEHEALWAVFPITRLRPEQVVGAISQASRLETISSQSHILVKLKRLADQQGFLQRYGDAGEEELEPHGGTIPQRLLMMNGEIVRDNTRENLLANAATQIAVLASKPQRAVETAFLCVLTRRPTPEEFEHFSARLRQGDGNMAARMEDLYWALFNCSEFSWNH